MIRSTSLALALVSLSALAQAEGPPPPPPPPPPPMVDTPMEEEADVGRVRWGINAQLGAFLPQPAVMFGLEGRVGYQLSRMLGFYFNLGGAVGVGFTASSTSTSSSASLNVVAYWTVGFLGELTFFDHLFLALGPTLADGAWAGVAASANTGGTSSTTVVATAGFMPALDFKVGFGLGGRNARTGRRNHFTLGVDVLVLFAPNATYVRSTNGGADVTTHGLAVGLVPTLMLGYDAR
jgi:hypothetical protein